MFEFGVTNHTWWCSMVVRQSLNGQWLVRLKKKKHPHNYPNYSQLFNRVSYWNWSQIKFRKTTMCQKLNCFINFLNPTVIPHSLSCCTMWLIYWTIKHIFLWHNFNYKLFFFFNLWLATRQKYIPSACLRDFMPSLCASGRFKYVRG